MRDGVDGSGPETSLLLQSHVAREELPCVEGSDRFRFQATVLVQHRNPAMKLDGYLAAPQ